MRPEAAEALEVDRPFAFGDDAGAQKQQPFEEAVVERMEQRGDEGERRDRMQPFGPREERDAEADRDDADVFDRRVGQQPLEIALGEREEHAADRAHRAEREQRDAPPRRSRRREDE